MEVAKFSDLRIGNCRNCLVIRPRTTPAQQNWASSTERESCNLQLGQSFNKSWKTSGLINDSYGPGDTVTLLRVGLPRWYLMRTHSGNETFIPLFQYHTW